MHADAHWEPLSLRRLLRHFPTLAGVDRVEDHLARVPGLLPEERNVLRFLHAVYGGSLATVRLYARYVSGLLNHARVGCADISVDMVDAYVRTFERRGAKPATRVAIVAALRSFFRHMHAAGLTPSNPMALYKKHRAEGRRVLAGHLTHSLGQEELEGLFAGLRALGAPLRDRALFVLLFMTGLRAEELVRLTRGQLVRWQGQWYLDVDGKGSKQRRVYVPAPALEALQAHLRALPTWAGGEMAVGDEADPERAAVPAQSGQTKSGQPGQAKSGQPGKGQVVKGQEKAARRSHSAGAADLPLLGHLRDPRKPLTRHGVYVLVKKWCAQLVEGRGGAVSPHWFRHSCFTQLALKGVPLEAIKALAGHESVETTMRYNEAAALMDAPGKCFE